MLEISERIIRLNCVNVKEKYGYKAISALGEASTCGLSTNKKEETKFSMSEENVLESNRLIAPTKWGFHYCAYLSEVLFYRPYAGIMNRKTNTREYFKYCEIEATGERMKERRGSEIVTDKFKIVKELEKEDILLILEKEKEMFLEFVNTQGMKKKHYQKLIEIAKNTCMYIKEMDSRFREECSFYPD